MSSTPEPIDEATARELALAALREITPATTVGDYRDSTVDADGVVTLRFDNRMPGYPGWYWTVGVAQVEGAAPTVLEAELMPGDGALTAPDWLPWAERLAEYQAAQAALAAEGLATDDLAIGDEEDLDDVDDLDALDFDNDGSPILHSGDVDGVDIDELADDESEGSDEDDSVDDSDDDHDDDHDDDDDEPDEDESDDDDDDESDEDESDDDDESDDGDDDDDESDEDDDDDSDDEDFDDDDRADES
ncbi:MAG: DUF3027 domain-containing protein [Microbacterium sp.]